MSMIAETEEGLMGWIVDFAHVHGWLAHHTRPARTAKGWRTPVQGDKGFPDLVLARKGRVIFAELKSEKGALDLNQANWIAAIIGTKGLGRGVCSVHVWRPSDREQIMEILR